MISHQMFPTLIGEWSYDRSNQFVETFFQNVLNHCDADGRTGESSGHVDVHHDKDFSNLFTMITDCAKEYVAQLSIDTDLWDFNLVKSWLSISDKSSIPAHDHADAHLSFVYYVNIPDSAPTAPIHFINKSTPNDLTGNMFYINPSENGSMSGGSVREWNQFNSRTWNFVPHEGMILIFPGHIPHHTDTGPDFRDSRDIPTTNVEEIRKRRVSLAGDFILTFKKKQPICCGLQPVSNWKVFA